jgi:preprotein translocase subunit SecD
MEKQRAFIILIIVLVATAIVTLINLPLQLGLDLRGGSQLTIQLETTPEVPKITPEKLEGVRVVIDNRVNGLGVSEAVVQSVGDDRILVQLPGVSDPETAERVLGGTAQLDFRQETNNLEVQAEYQAKQKELTQNLFELQTVKPEEKQAKEAKIQELQQQLFLLSEKIFEKTELNGEKLKSASYQPSPQGETWEVVLEFNDQGGQLFAQITKEIAGTGRRLGIFLDDNLISSPGVSAEYAANGIAGGRATISGGNGFTLEQAKELALQLEGGALPVPVKIVENRTVGATLGQDSIRSSIVAGLAGLGLVFVFMIVYYRLPGFIANIAYLYYPQFSLFFFGGSYFNFARYSWFCFKYWHGS